MTRERSTEDLPPPYSENPPVNPFYNEQVHSVNTSDINRSRYSLDNSVSLDDRPLVVSPPCHNQPDPHRFSPIYSSNPLYPVLPNIPPYSAGVGVQGVPTDAVDHSWREYQMPANQEPPPFSAVTRRDPFLRRDSYFSDNEDASDAMGNLHLHPQ